MATTQSEKHLDCNGKRITIGCIVRPSTSLGGAGGGEVVFARGGIVVYHDQAEGRCFAAEADALEVVHGVAVNVDEDEPPVDEFGREITVGSLVADGGVCTIGIVTHIIGDTVIVQGLLDDGWGLKAIGDTTMVNIGSCVVFYDPARPELIPTRDQLAKFK